MNALSFNSNTKICSSRRALCYDYYFKDFFILSYAPFGSFFSFANFLIKIIFIYRRQPLLTIIFAKTDEPFSSKNNYYV